MDLELQDREADVIPLTPIARLQIEPDCDCDCDCDCGPDCDCC